MKPLDSQVIARLLNHARDARDQAYAPHSHFYVGAAILTADGSIVGGCNVENASYGLTICAERVAGGAAVASGHRDWNAIAIASDGGVSPCGACRQFLAEFCPDLWILRLDVITEQHTMTTLRKLLPEAFTPASLQSS